MSQRWAIAAFFVESFLLFSLGVGVAKYLGSTVIGEQIGIGYLWVFCLQLGGVFLWRHATGTMKVKDNGRLRVSPYSTDFILAIAAFASSASLTVLMIAGRLYTLGMLGVTLLAILGTLIGAKTLRIAETDRFREIILSFVVAVLIPWFAFLLQTGELHRFLPLVTLPLWALRMAMVLSYQLSTYASDLNAKNQTLMLRIGWQNGMALHNALILFAFFLIALGNVIGIPLSIGLPPLAALILGLGQIWNMRRIAQGVKPNWRGLIWGGVALYGLVIYLYAYSFWIR
ncbi:MAG: hypothetical protein N3D16_06265 [Anaerolineales bacterium]|nr:hypothetical protein [Anaerolineales bacterium]